jgi:hypothetical protein
MYGEGVSKTGEILDLAVEFEIIKNQALGLVMKNLDTDN